MDGLYQVGVAAFNANDLSKARAVFAQVAESVPSWEPLLALAHVHMRLREPEAAAASLDAALSSLTALGERAPWDSFCSAARPLLHLPHGRASHACGIENKKSDGPLLLTQRSCGSANSSDPFAHACQHGRKASASLPDDSTDSAALLSARVGICVCAYASEGTNAQIDDWLMLHRCTTGGHVVLHDARPLDAIEYSAASWSLRPFVDAGDMTWLRAATRGSGGASSAGGGDEGSAETSRAAARTPGPAWASLIHAEGGLDADATVTRAMRMRMRLVNESMATRAARDLDLRHPPDSEQRSICTAHLAQYSTCHWMALLEAPFESFHQERAVRTTGADAGRTDACPAVANRSRLSHARASAVRLGIVRFGRPHASDAHADEARPSLEVPPRPLAVRSTARLREWGGCVRDDGALCAALDDTAMLINLDADANQSSSDSELGSDGEGTLILAPTAPEALKVHRYSSRAVADPAAAAGNVVTDTSGRTTFEACAAASELGTYASPRNDATDSSNDAPQPPIDAAHAHSADGRSRVRAPRRRRADAEADGDFFSWITAAKAAVAHGDGVARLRGALTAGDAQALRDSLLSLLPPHKRTTRVFANHMCQCVDGEPRSAGHDPACEPLSPVLLQLATHSKVVRFARSLLGDDCVLHNAGLSLVTPAPSGASSQALAQQLSAHLPHQDQPINGAAIWSGRTPPPTHPLSLQALWMLDDFTMDNGAFYALLRSQWRSQHVEAWASDVAAATNSSAGTARAAAAQGLFPARIVTGSAGDVAFALGSLWHAPSTSVAGQRPRLALLFEYAPAFVTPRDRYMPAMLRRYRVSAEDAKLFPQLPEAYHPSTARAEGGASVGTDGGCDPRDAVSVYEWYALARQRPWCLHARTRIILRGGVASLPALGLGTGSPEDDPAVIAAAIRAGYSLIDTGELYANEAAIRESIAQSGAHRESLIISSKAGRWCEGELPASTMDHVPPEYRAHAQQGLLRGFYRTTRGTLGRGVCIGGAAETRAALERTLARLGTDYVDVFLLHWPLTHAAYALDDGRHAAMRLEAWRELSRLKRRGKIRAIGVSNFNERQIDELVTVETPQLLQVEMHPLLQRPTLRAYCEARGIMLQAYGHHRSELRDNSLLLAVAAQHGIDAEKTSAVGLLAMRWSLQAGAALIPRSRRHAYVQDNLKVFQVPHLPAGALGVLRGVDANMSLYGLHEAFVRDWIA